MWLWTPHWPKRESSRPVRVQSGFWAGNLEKAVPLRGPDHLLWRGLVLFWEFRTFSAQTAAEMITRLWSAELSSPQQTLYSWVPGHEEQRLFNIAKQLKPGTTVWGDWKASPASGEVALVTLGLLALLLSMPPLAPRTGRCDLLSSSIEMSHLDFSIKINFYL